MIIMEKETSIMDGHKSDSEDMYMSDHEDSASPEKVTLSIDCNARIVSKVEKYDGDGSENWDMYYVDKNKLAYRRGSENRNHTSVEDLDVSDEELCCSSLQPVNLDRLTCSANQNLSSLSTLNYSHTGYKDEFTTDADNVSDEESHDDGLEKRYFSKDAKGKFYADTSIAKTDWSVDGQDKTLNSLNIKNVFTKSLIIDENHPSDVHYEQGSPPLTCLEFVKSEYGDECNTDTEDLSAGSQEDISETSEQNKSYMPISIENVKDFQSEDNNTLYPGNRRRSSAAVLTEDETFNFENFCDSGRKKFKKRSYMVQDNPEISDKDSSTDEEDLERVNREWTETDDSGGVRQITQIKTETSIKLEGDDIGTEGDDVISRTTTTTTRIVTTVTTDGEQENHEDQQIMGDGDDLRHSVEVILNQFMSSDSDATKPEDSTTEHDE